jgi:PAS domain-containing protein
VILRVFRGAIAPDQRARILAHVRDVLYPAATGMARLGSFQAGLRTSDDGSLELAVITTWSDFTDIVEALGPDLDRPRWMSAVADAYEPRSSQHYELVGQQIRGVFPMEGAIVRVFEGRLARTASETFFDFARARQEELIDQGLILASHIGRRIMGNVEEAIYVVLWRDAEAIASLGGDGDRPAALGEWQSFFDSWRLDRYDALTRVSPRGGTDRALLLADDERRYVFATPEAARLIDRPVGRILGRRIDDIANAGTDGAAVDGMWADFLAVGTQVGEIELTGRDGEVHRVGFVARANVPWPGCHVSLLVPPGEEPGPETVDEALADVGIVARYPVPAT